MSGELAQGGKLPALALYRTLAGASLPEAMAFIDRLTASVPPAAPPLTDSLRELDAVEMRELRGLLMDGARLAAVKYYREKTGAWAEQALAFVQDQVQKAEQDAEQNAPPLPQPLLDLCVEALASASGKEARLAELRAQWSDAQRLAAMRRAEKLLDLAERLCEQVRAGKVKEPDLHRELRAAAPGFGHDAYARAFDSGMRSTL